MLAQIVKVSGCKDIGIRKLEFAGSNQLQIFLEF
jgi:hypothetical protein